jgi:integrase
MSRRYYFAMLPVAEKIGRCVVCLGTRVRNGPWIGSIRQLKCSDVDLERGTIIWRAENDKMGFEHETVVSAQAVTVVRVERDASAAVDSPWVFPSPKNSKRSRSHHLPRDYWSARRNQRGSDGSTIRMALAATEVRDRYEEHTSQRSVPTRRMEGLSNRTHVLPAS